MDQIDLSKCNVRKRKLNDNSVIVEYYLYDKDNKEIIIEQEEFGQPKIDREINILLEERDKVDSFNKIGELNKIDIKIQEIEDIQDVLQDKIKK